MAAVEGVGCRALARIRIGEQIVAHLALEGSAVCMAVHHVAAHAEDFLISDVEIHSERLGVIDALVAAEPAEAVSVAVGEAKLIGVVGRTDEGNLVVVPEAVHIERGLIAVVGAIAGLDGSEPAVFHPFLHREVDYGLVLAVVYTRQARQVAFAVYHLEFVDHVYRQIL